MALILIIVGFFGYFWLKYAFKAFDFGVYNDNKDGNNKYESDN